MIFYNMIGEGLKFSISLWLCIWVYTQASVSNALETNWQKMDIRSVGLLDNTQQTDRSIKWHVKLRSITHCDQSAPVNLHHNLNISD